MMDIETAQDKINKISGVIEEIEKKSAEKKQVQEVEAEGPYKTLVQNMTNTLHEYVAVNPEDLSNRINGILEASGVTLGYSIGLAQSFGAEIDDKWLQDFMAEVKTVSIRYKNHFNRVRETPESQP